MVEFSRRTYDEVVYQAHDDDAVSLVDVRARTVVWTRETPAHPFGAIVV